MIQKQQLNDGRPEIRQYKKPNPKAWARRARSNKRVKMLFLFYLCVLFVQKNCLAFCLPPCVPVVNSFSPA